MHFRKQVRGDRLWKIAYILALVFPLVICLYGCYPNKEMFELENADRVAVKGIEMMQF